MLIDGEKPPVLPAGLVAREKGCFVETVYRAIEAGKLNGYHVPSGSGVLRTWLVHNDAALDAWQPPRGGRPRAKHPRPNRSAKMKTDGT